MLSKFEREFEEYRWLVGKTIHDQGGHKGIADAVGAVSDRFLPRLRAAATEEGDPFDEWMAALAYVEPGQELFLNRGGKCWYANIRHQKGYVVWYMPGDSPIEALVALTEALAKHKLPTFEHKGDFARASGES